MRAVLVACSLIVMQLIGAMPAQGAGASARTHVVDDDRAQCGNAAFDTVGAAVDAAQPGDIVRVCPGTYRETITIDKSITLRGQPDAIEAIDCWDPAPSTLGDSDPNVHAILDASQSTDLSILTVVAANVVVEGFVLQGARNAVLPADEQLFRRAIDLSADYDGYRVHHNLFRLNTLAINFGSAGSVESRFDHNCLRDNLWGQVKISRPLVNARIDHNVSLRTFNFAYELASSFAEDVTIDHNRARQDTSWLLVRNSVNVRILDNTIESTRTAIAMAGGAPNIGTEVARNVVTINPAYPGRLAPQQGIAFGIPAPGQAPNSGAFVHDNVITGMRDGIVAAGPPVFPVASVVDSRIANNVTSGNMRDGITIRGGNARNTLTGNIANDNGQYGIYLQCGTDGVVCAVNNMVEANTMLGNAVTDARDDAWPRNTWVGNICVTDVPVGAIC